MKRKEMSADGITSARDKIVRKHLRNTDRRYDRGRENIIYFDGWNGFGASAVLAAIAESVRTDGPKFDIVIHVDCSVWESRREMQRKIAEELKLDRSVMVLFDKQDEEDDFSGVDKGSRAEIDDVAELIFQAAEDRRCLIIFHNGSDNEIDLSTSGVPVFDSKNKVLWTFRVRFRLIDPTITEKVQSAHIFLSACPTAAVQLLPCDHEVTGSSPGNSLLQKCRERLRTKDPSGRTLPRTLRKRELHAPGCPCPTANIWYDNDLSAVVHEEAAQVSHDISPTVITDCWLYLSLLHYNHDNSSDYDGDSHASNYWVCDGIMPGDSAWEIADRLHEEMRLEYLPTKQDHGKWLSSLVSKKRRAGAFQSHQRM